MKKRKNEDLFIGTDKLITIRDWVRFFVSVFNREKLFFGQGMSSAYDESVYLILHTLCLPQEGPETFFDAKLTTAEIELLKDVLVKRVINRTPASYITKEAWLGEYRFYVDERVIIPRSYFAEIIPGELLNWCKNPELIERVADVCTGGGSLAILLANTFPNAQVDAFDISIPALEVASKNIEEYGLQEQISIFQSDVLDEADEKALYDIIISNPPYEPNEIRKMLPKEFLAEPDNALFSGDDGMDVIRKLLKQSAKKLKKTGILLIEVGGLQDALESAFSDIEFNWLATSDASDCVCLIHASELKKLLK